MTISHPPPKCYSMQSANREADSCGAGVVVSSLSVRCCTTTTGIDSSYGHQLLLSTDSSCRFAKNSKNIRISYVGNSPACMNTIQSLVYSGN